MNLHSVFLRSGCLLPDGVAPRRKPVGDEWSVVEETPALVFDAVIRRAGWHFIWMQESCSRSGVGITQEGAIRRALSRALNGVAKRFNAAELDCIHITQFPGFQIANVTVQTLQIQESSSLNFAGGNHPRPSRQEKPVTAAQ